MLYCVIPTTPTELILETDNDKFTVKRVAIKLFCIYDNRTFCSCMSFAGFPIYYIQWKSHRRTQN